MRQEIHETFKNYPPRAEQNQQAEILFETLTAPVKEPALSPIKVEHVLKLEVKHVVPKRAKPAKVRAYDRQKGMCPYCDTFIADIMHMTWDHIVPVSKGGQNTTANKILVCDPCNQTKSNCSTFLEAAEKAGLATQKAFDVQQRALRLLALMKRLKDKGIIKS